MMLLMTTATVPTSVVDAHGRRHCESCFGFLRNEPDEIVDLGISYGEDGPEHDGLDEIRRCRGCGHENTEWVSA